MVPAQKERNVEMPSALPVNDLQFQTFSNTGLMMEVVSAVYRLLPFSVMFT